MFRKIESYFGKSDPEVLAKRLCRPSGHVDVVIDTDTYNGSDDQFAIAYLAKSPEECTIRAITAAPFYNKPEWKRVSRSVSPLDGMEKSVTAIHELLDVLDMPQLKTKVYRGAGDYLPAPTVPVDSEAARKIIEISQDYDSEHPLYIAALACLTNIASALLVDPTLRHRIFVVWLGGNAWHLDSCTDFNAWQDIAAVNVVFGCGVPVVQYACQGIGSEFRFSRPELEAYLGGKNKLCDYLLKLSVDFASLRFPYEMWSKPIYDAEPAGWLLNGGFSIERILPAPVFQEDGTYSFPPDRPPVRYVTWVDKDPLAMDLFARLVR